MQIVAYLPGVQGQVPINLVNDVDQRMYQYMNDIRNGTQKCMFQIQMSVNLLP